MSPLQKGHFTAKRRHLHRTAFPGTARQGRCGGLRGEKGFCSELTNGLENRNDVTQPRRGDLILAGEQFVHNPKGVTFSVESFHPFGIMFRAPPPLPSCHPFGIEALAIFDLWN